MESDKERFALYIPDGICYFMVKEGVLNMTTEKKKSDRYILAVYLILFGIIAAVMAVSQPDSAEPPYFAGPPDESARMLIPRYICEHGVIPTGLEEEVRIPGYGFSYGLYNVFPYIVQGYAMRFAGMFTDSDRMLLYVARFVNVFFGMCMAWVVYRLSKRLFADRRLQWIFCFGVMYLPESMFVHTYVNTDSMNLLSVAIIIYAWVRACQDGFDAKASMILSLGIVLCALSYYNAYGYILSSILLFLGFYLKKEGGRISYDWRNMLKWGICISAAVLLGIGWWFLRAYIVLDGDLLGLRTRTQMAIQYAVPEANPLYRVTYQSQGVPLLQMFRETDFWRMTLDSFIAVFGSLSIVGNLLIYRFYKLFFAGALLACLVLPEQKGSPANMKRERRLFFHVNMIFCVMMVFALMVVYSYTVDLQRQGRYLLPALIPLYYYLVHGVEKGFGIPFIPERLKSAGSVLLVAAVVAVCLWMVFGAALPVYRMASV